MNRSARRAWSAVVILLAALAGGQVAGSESPEAVPYGPLSFNKRGADFYFAQDGEFVPTAPGQDGAIEVRLKRAPFQVGYNGHQLNITLAQAPIQEISTDPKGFKASRLSGPMTGAREPDSDVLLVYPGTDWSDGNTEFSDATSRKAKPERGFRHAYQVNTLLFTADDTLSIAGFTGTLHGYIVVYRQHERRNQDIMPVRLIFE
jgi:hypothetical protein